MNLFFFALTFLIIGCMVGLFLSALLAAARITGQAEVEYDDNCEHWLDCEAADLRSRCGKLDDEGALDGPVDVDRAMSANAHNTLVHPTYFHQRRRHAET